MGRLAKLLLCACALAAGCQNFGFGKSGSQTMRYDSDERRFVPTDDALYMSREPIDLPKR
jgi:hypothetical protein